MGDSKIEWTDKTWNPVRGCQIVSAGCKNCYAMQQAHRFSGPGQPYEGLTQLAANGPVWTGTARAVPEMLEVPLHWRTPVRVFVNSMSDLFHEDVPFGFIDQVFAVMARCPHHTFQILTKRPEQAAAWYVHRSDVAVREGGGAAPWYEPPPNVWLGVSVEDAKAAGSRIPKLMALPAAVRFLSCEPLLGPLDLRKWLDRETARCRACTREPLDDDCGCFCHRATAIDWLIAGGESGPGARPMHPDWVRGIRDQCQAAGVPFFFKQWGAHVPMVGRGLHEVSPKTAIALYPDGRRVHPNDSINRPDVTLMLRVGKKAAGRLLDGVEWNDMPRAAAVAVPA